MKKFNGWVLVFGVLYLWSKFDENSKISKKNLWLLTLLSCIPFANFPINIYLAVKNNAHNYVDTEKQKRLKNIVLPMVLYFVVSIPLNAIVDKMFVATPNCSAKESVYEVESTFEREYKKARKFLMKDDYDKLTKQTFKLYNIRTKSYNEQIDKYYCIANIQLDVIQDGKYLEASKEITYDVQRVEDNENKIFVNIQGL